MPPRQLPVTPSEPGAVTRLRAELQAAKKHAVDANAAGRRDASAAWMQYVKFVETHINTASAESFGQLVRLLRCRCVLTSFPA